MIGYHDYPNYCEVIIAQNGAVKTHMNGYNITMTITVTLLGVVILLGLIMYCRYRIRNWITKIISRNVTSNPIGDEQPASRRCFRGRNYLQLLRVM